MAHELAHNARSPKAFDRVDFHVGKDAGRITEERHADILGEVGIIRRQFVPPPSGYEVIAHAFATGNAGKYSPEDLARAGVIDASKSNNEGQERRLEEVKKIVVRKTSDAKPGDKPAHFRIKEDGTIEQLRNPDRKRDGTDDEIIIEVDNSAANQVRAMSERQKAAIRQTISYIEARYAAARMSPVIPSDLLAALYQEPEIPPPVVRQRSGGYNGSRLTRSPVTSIPPAPAGGFEPRSVGRSTASDRQETEMFDRMGPQRSFETPEQFKGFIDRVVDAISRNEGSFTSINWNDNGHGISVGKAQFNQKAGELPSFLKKCHDADPQRFNEIFGPYAQQMLDERFVRSASITRGSDLGNRMQALLREPFCQQVQTELLRAKVVKAFELSQKYGHTSELFVAQVADMGNQFGWGGVEACLRKSNAANIRDERQAIQALSEAGQDRWAKRAGRDQRLAQVFSPDRPAMA
ncbi:MAG TPA: hypothetical protein V6D08_03645 [Candidatus Obscuribacterales bacterium]